MQFHCTGPEANDGDTYVSLICQINMLKSNIQDKDETIESLKSILSKKNNQIKQQQLSSFNIHSLCEKLQQQISQMQQTLSKQKKDWNNINNKVNQQERTILHQHQNIQILNEQCYTLQQQIQSLEQAKQAIHCDITTQTKNWQIQINMNRSTLQHEMLKCEQFKLELENQQLIFSNLQRKYDEQHQMLIIVEESNTQLIAEKAKFRQICRPLCDHLKKIENSKKNVNI